MDQMCFVFINKAIDFNSTPLRIVFVEMINLCWHKKDNSRNLPQHVLLQHYPRYCCSAPVTSDTNDAHFKRISPARCCASAALGVKTVYVECFLQRATQLHPLRASRITLFNSSMNTDVASAHGKNYPMLHERKKKIVIIIIIKNLFKTIVAVLGAKRPMCAPGVRHTAADINFRDLNERVQQWGDDIMIHGNKWLSFQHSPGYTGCRGGKVSVCFGLFS